ncbi:MAG: hypothetical protein MUC72_07105 [Acidobacteria bacterium]|jgi:hypothetical protein|nr:hypothetical protein [Acidobacteriota bacterium]
MKNWRWQLSLSIGLVLLSAGLYGLHFFVFRDAHHIFIYLLGDIAFLPVDVLFVTLIIHRLLSDRDRRAKLKKLNMVIGSFFSETGNGLLRLFLSFEKNAAALKALVLRERGWSDRDLRALQQQLPGYGYDIDARQGDLAGLKAFLTARRGFLLSLLGNPNLLEHDKFTDLLWSVFHLTDELVQRQDLAALPPSDLQHLAQDLRRAFHLLLLEWLAYMQHLKHAYPYLFSLAVRTNPFDPDASPVVR